MAMILAQPESRLLNLLDSLDDPADRRLRGETRKMVLGVLPAALLRKYDETGRSAVLDRTIPFLRRRLTEPGLDAELRSSLRANLVVALLRDHERTGGADVLEAAIAESRTLLDGADTSPRPGHEARSSASGDDLAGRLATLAHLYALRAAGFNSPGDLRRSITLLTRAVAVPGISAGKASECWSDLAGAWRDEFARTGEPAALHEAVAALQEAVGLAPRGSEAARINRVNLAGTRRRYAVLTRDAAALDSSIADLEPLGDGPHALHNRGVAFRERYRFTGDPADLARGVATLRAALAGYPAEQQLHAVVAAELAAALLLTEYGTEEALDLLDAVVTHRAATAVTRFRAARTAAERRTGTAALGSWRQAVGLLPVLAWRGSRYQDRESAVGRYSGVTLTAAARAVAVGEAAQAVTLLETGRGVLWNQLLELRGDLDRVREADRRLADRLAAVRAQLDRGSG